MLNLPKVNKTEEDTFTSEEKNLGRSRGVILNLMLLLLAFTSAQIPANAFTDNKQVIVGHTLNMINGFFKGDIHQGHFSHSSHMSHSSHHSHYSSRW